MDNPSWKFNRTQTKKPIQGKPHFVVAHIDGLGWDCSYAIWDDRKGWMTADNDGCLLADALEEEQYLDYGFFDGYRNTNTTYWAKAEDFAEFDEALDHFKDFTAFPSLGSRLVNALKVLVRAYYRTQSRLFGFIEE